MTGPPAQEPAPGLLRRASAGDDAAFAALYHAYARPVFTLAARMLRQREAAEDVLQEVFVELTRALPAYRGDGPFWGWLRRLAVSKVLMRLRAERSRITPERYEDDSPDAYAHPDDETGRALLARDLGAALDHLPDVSRAVVWLHDVEGWTHQEIAAAMGRSASFSKSQLARAHTKLRALLEAGTYASEH